MHVLAALLSLFVPGLGQLCQGRALAAVLWVLVLAAVWVGGFAWVGFFVLPFAWTAHLFSAYEAATWRER